MVLIACPWALAFYLGPSYDVNDDVGNVLLLQEFFGASSADASIFVSNLLTQTLVGLYRSVPVFPWYELVLYSSLAASQLLLMRLIVVTMTSSVARWCLLIATSTVLFFLVLYTSFTSAGLLLTSSALLAGTVGCTSGKPGMRATCWVLVGVGFLVRPGVLPIAALLLAPVATAAIFSQRARWQSVLRSWLPVVAVVLSLFCIELAIESPSKAAFRQANAVRAVFSDTAWGNVTESFEQALFAAGWTENDYLVARSLWWYSDESVHSQDALTQFTTVNRASSPLPWNLINLQFNLLSTRYALGLHAAVICAWLGSMGACRRPWFWATLAVSAGCLLAIAGLRFPLRIAYPFLLILGLAPVAGIIGSDGGSKRAPRRPFFLTATVVLFVWSVWSPVQGYRRAQHVLGRLQSAVETAQREIVDHRPEAVFVPLALDGFWQGSFFRPLQPLTLHRTLPSGWLGQSPARHAFLDANGFSNEQPLVPQLLDRDAIIYYFLAKKSDTGNVVFNPFLGYLNQHYGTATGDQRLTARVVATKDIDPYVWVFFQIERP